MPVDAQPRKSAVTREGGKKSITFYAMTAGWSAALSGMSSLHVSVGYSMRPSESKKRQVRCEEPFPTNLQERATIGTCIIRGTASKQYLVL